MGAGSIKKLLVHVPTWHLAEGKLVRAFEFKNFEKAISFVNAVAKIAEKENHHPDILIHSWNKVRLTLFTHKIQGLHENDFILAAKIDKLEE